LPWAIGGTASKIAPDYRAKGKRRKVRAARINGIRQWRYSSGKRCDNGARKSFQQRGTDDVKS
jgi:hypothetical protein